MSKREDIDWSSDIEKLIYELESMLKLISSFEYFKYFKSWNASVMELTSDSIALNFMILTYKDWIRKGKPMGDSRAKQFQKNCFYFMGQIDI